MKKILILLLITTVLLCGCQANGEKENTSEYYDELSKVQEIAVISANTGITMQTLTELEELSDFISALDMEHWELETLPKESKWIGTFQFSQEKPLNLVKEQPTGSCTQFVKYSAMKEFLILR